MTAFGLRFLAASVFVSLVLTPSIASARQATAYGSASFRIKVPRKPSTLRRNVLGLHGLRPQYISVSTESFSVQANDLKPVVVNVTSSNYAYITLRVPAGMYRFTVTAYDKPGGTGNVLSAGATPLVNVPAKGHVYASVTLSGVAATVALSLGELHATVGSPANIGLQVETTDADGNLFLGPVDPSQKITLTSSDPLDAVIEPATMTQSGNSASDPFFSARVAYTGASVGSITFSASGAGLKSIIPAVLVPLSPPSSGEQIIATQYVDPISSFSTLPGYQFLGTLGTPPPSLGGSDNVYYNKVAVDDAAHLLYVGTSKNDFTNEIDSFQTDSPRSFVDSIPLVSTSNGAVAGMAVDAAGKRLYASTYDASFNIGISIYSTATGHALLGRISTPYRFAELAVDPVAGRLYAAENNGDLAVYQSSPPFALLASYPGNLYPNQYYSVAADSTTGKVYLFLGVPDSSYSVPSFIDTYDGSNLGLRLAHTAIGTQYAGVLAIDTVGRRLYVTAPGFFPENDPSDPRSVINAYTIDGGIALVGSFPVRSQFGNMNGIAIAPLATANAARTRIRRTRGSH